RGKVFTSRGKINVHPVAHRLSDEPLDPECSCSTCATYSLGYLNHLSKCGEPTGWRLLALHNLHFYMKLMTDIRGSIEHGTYSDFYSTTLARWQQRPLHPPSKKLELISQPTV